jgi:multiple sugar transport system permease protein
MTADIRTAPVRPVMAPAAAPKSRPRRGRWGVHIFLSAVSLAFIAPLLLAVYASLRPYDETAQHGYFSWPKHISLTYYRQAYTQSDMGKYFTNTLTIAIPAVIVTLFLSSFVAFAVSRLKLRGGIVVLMFFTAGNLLPQQVIVTPLYVLFNKIPLPWWMSDSLTMYDSLWAVIIVNIGFQMGFCVFVLSNFMRTLPQEILEAAIVDGAGVWTQFWRITLPLCRPALAALATLEFIWIYNDFFWALLFIQSGDRLPITTGINNLFGTYASNDNLIAAGAIMTAIPTLAIYVALQRQFVAGLTLGSSKG